VPSQILIYRLPISVQVCTPFSPYNVMYSGWVGDDDSSFVGLRACAHKVALVAAVVVGVRRVCCCAQWRSILSRCSCEVEDLRSSGVARHRISVSFCCSFVVFVLRAIVEQYRLALSTGDLLRLDGLRQLRLRRGRLPRQRRHQVRHALPAVRAAQRLPPADGERRRRRAPALVSSRIRLNCCGVQNEIRCQCHVFSMWRG
jgi:hypothetical protein